MNYDKIKIGDRIDYSCNDPFGILIKINTAGISHALDMKVPTHTGIVCQWEGQYLVAGMRKTLSIESLENHDIIGAYRHPAITDDIREVLNRTIAYDVRLHLDYDYLGMLGMCPILKFFKENNKKYFCSEYFVYLTKSYIGFKTEEYSPYELLKYPGFIQVC
jgi:hypothetical protein